MNQNNWKLENSYCHAYGIPIICIPIRHDTSINNKYCCLIN